MTAVRTATLITAAALALAACGDDAGDVTTDTTTSEPTATSAPSPTTEAPGRGGDGSPSGLSVEAADDTVRAWVEALATGELEAAWDLVAERSREAIGGFQAFTDLRSALAEGFGAWAGAGEDAFAVVPLDAGEGEALSLVVLRGTIPQEGPPAPAADAVPVRTTSQGSLVEPFLDLGAVEHEPPPGTAIPAEPNLAALVPAEPEVRFVVDDRGAQSPTNEAAEGGRQRASLEVHVPLEPGPHSLTVVLTTPGGDISTSTALYQVEG